MTKLKPSQKVDSEWNSVLSELPTIILYCKSDSFLLLFLYIDMTFETALE